jgi:hypothetical protein
MFELMLRTAISAFMYEDVPTLIQLRVMSADIPQAKM